MKSIKVKDVVGEEFSPEDAIIVRQMIGEYLEKGKDNVELDFEDINRVPTTFLCNLYSELFYEEGRKYILSRVNVKNISNKSDYKRVVLGTAF